MNKPAPKEPSMDEILSSIRQIIADDDAASTPRRPMEVLPEPTASVALSEPEEQEPMPSLAAEVEPLALSADQILSGPAAEPAPEEESDTIDFSAFTDEEAEDDEVKPPGLQAEFIDPEDITFEPEKAPEPVPAPFVAPPAPPPSFSRPAPPPAMPQPERPRPSAAHVAPMPDPKLSSDIAEELLEPTTNAAVRANFSRLSSLGLGNPGLTIEAMMRDMLRPMLKEWLDEHLPAVVERMVEKEIARISRGLD